MNSRHSDYQGRRADHLLTHFAPNGTYYPGGREVLVLERAEHTWVYDTAGRRYFDGLSSLFCAQLGYSYGEEFAAAIQQQLRQLPFNTNYTTAHPPAIDLATRLSEFASGRLNKAFLVSGGSEAVEAAWKIARQHFVARGEGQRTKAIARHGAYHGASMGALAFTGIATNKEAFGPPAIPVRHVSSTVRFRQPDGDDEARWCARLLREIEDVIEAEGADTVAAIVAEPVQNPGGCLPPPAGYWQGLRTLADRYGILLWADEVITGFGRIGEWLATERFGGDPDIVTVAKGMAAAYAPAGAVLITDEVAAPLLEPGNMLLHGFTFGGNPLASAATLKNIEIFEREGVLENVRALEQRLADKMQELLALPLVGDVRGAGFFWAAELVDAEASDGRFDTATRDLLVADVVAPALLDAGLIVRVEARAGDPTIQIAPPLICDGDELDWFVDRLGEALAQAERSLHQQCPASVS